MCCTVLVCVPSQVLCIRMHCGAWGSGCGYGRYLGGRPTRDTGRCARCVVQVLSGAPGASQQVALSDSTVVKAAPCKCAPISWACCALTCACSHLSYGDRPVRESAQE
jgi:hypothetical protein